MRRFPFAALLMLFASACSDFALEPDESPTSLHVTPDTATLLPDGTFNLEISAIDFRGRQIDRVPEWVSLTVASSNPETAVASGTRISAISPGEAELMVTMAGLQQTAVVRVNPEAVRLDIASAMLIQPGSEEHGIQTGVETELRVFLTADEVNFFRPTVRVLLFLDGELAESVELEREGDSIPLALDTSDPTAAWRGTIPAELVRPGLELVILADPDMSFGHAPGSRDRYPAVGAFPVPVGQPAIRLEIAGAYIVQSIQRFDGSVPLVAGQPGLLRVFITTDKPNDLRLPVRATFLRNGTVIHQADLINDAPYVPPAVIEGQLSYSWNIVVPGWVLQSGVSMVIEADPNFTVARNLGSRMRYPESGAMSLYVREVPPLWLRMVPIHQTSIGLTGNITPANLPQYLREIIPRFPLHDVDVDIRPPYVTMNTADSQAGWVSILQELRALRLADGSRRYYYGVLRHPGGNPYAGMGFIGHPAAVGYDHPVGGPDTFAHELGHNFNLEHAPCGGPDGADPAFPYPNGSIGHYGYDLSNGSLKSPAVYRDLMTYCDPDWISDYHYERVIHFRQIHDPLFTGPDLRPSGETVLLWGGVVSGSLILEPAFQIRTPPVLPVSEGPYRIRGLDEAGLELFSFRFDLETIDHVDDGAFAFAIPAEITGGDRLEEIVLEGPEGIVRRTATQVEPIAARRAGVFEREVVWDPFASPVALVRDALTGEVLSFARGGSLRLDDAPRLVEVVTSDGVRSVSRVVDLR